MNNLTNITIEMNGLVVGDNYQYDYFTEVDYLVNNSLITNPVMGPYSFTATATSETVNLTINSGNIEGNYIAVATLYDSSGLVLNSDYDSIYQEILIADSTSSTTGEIFASNLSVNSPYTLRWITLNFVTLEADLIANPSMTIGDAINASKIDEGYDNFTSKATTETWQVSWNNPTTMDEHLFFAMVYAQGAVYRSKFI
jgi:hypothetical protein